MLKEKPIINQAIEKVSEQKVIDLFYPSERFENNIVKRDI